MRVPRSCKSWEEIEVLMELADTLSRRAGTLCNKAGSKQHYHDGSGPEGRGLRISRVLSRADLLRTDLSADGTSTEPGSPSEHESFEE